MKLIKVMPVKPPEKRGTPDSKLVLKVKFEILTIPDIHKKLAEFEPDQKFAAQVVEGSPFLSLSISPTKPHQD